MIRKIKSKKNAQEEIIGFGVILIMIAVILVVFLSISNNKNKTASVEDFEASSFLKALLEQTTNCKTSGGYLSVKELIFECSEDSFCLSGENSCKMLNKTISDSLEAVPKWSISKDSSVRGYNFIIDTKSENLVNIIKGNLTNSYKGAKQSYSKSGDTAEIYIKIYS